MRGGTGGPLVVGVLAPEFELLLPPRLNEERTPDIWYAARLTYDTVNRNMVIHRVIGRLKGGATLDQAQAGTRFSLLLIGVIAALLAGVGLYGVLSNVVRQRTSEIGVRMALGATPGSVFKLVVGHGLRLSLIGVAAGMVAAFGLTRASALDPTIALREE